MFRRMLDAHDEDADTVRLLGENNDAEHEAVPREQKPKPRVYALALALLLSIAGVAYTARLHARLVSNVQDVDRFESAPCTTGSCNWMSDHRIKSRRSGRCLDWGDVIVKSQYCDRSSNTQLWIYNTTQHIRVPDGRCLDDGGSAVHIWDCKDTGNIAINQRWQYDPDSGQISQVSSTQLCLAESSGNISVYMQPCDTHSPDQEWTLRKSVLSPSIPVQAGQIQLRTGVCLDASGGRTHIWSCDPSNKNQDWTYNTNTKQILSFNGGCLSSSSVDTLQQCIASAPDQKWTLDLENGAIKAEAGTCLQAPDPHKNGSPVYLRECDFYDVNQQWHLEGLLFITQDEDSMSVVYVMVAIILGAATCAVVAALVCLQQRCARRKFQSRGASRKGVQSNAEAPGVHQVEAVAGAAEDLPQVASEGGAQEGAKQDPVRIMSHDTVDDLPSSKDTDTQLEVVGTPRRELDSPQQSALLSSELPHHSAPSQQSAPSDRSEATADSATPMLNRSRVVASGTPTWNGAPSGYYYEHGPSDLPQQSAPSQESSPSAPSDQSEAASDSASHKVGRCKTAGCGKPTWNGEPSGYCYERGPYGKSGLS